MIIPAKYAGTCATCGGAIHVGQLIVWNQGAKPTHSNRFQCAEAPPPQTTNAPKPEPVATLDGKAIADFLAAAKARGLKYPKARFLAPDGQSELRLSLAGNGSKAPGSIQVLIGDEWQGRIEPSGRIMGRLAYALDLIKQLQWIASNPATAAQQYGRLTCRCSFCNLPLNDAGSVEVGYGPVCAEHWGLPHKPRGSAKIGVHGPKPAPLDVDGTPAEINAQVDRATRMDAFTQGFEEV